MQAAFAGDDRAVAQVFRDRPGGQGGRHDNQFQIRANRLLHASRHREGEVQIQAAFVEFVKQNCGDRFQEGVVLQFPQQDSVRDGHKSGLRTAALVETDLISDLITKCGGTFECHPACRSARGQAAWF